MSLAAFLRKKTSLLAPAAVAAAVVVVAAAAVANLPALRARSTHFNLVSRKSKAAFSCVAEVFGFFIAVVDLVGSVGLGGRSAIFIHSV